MPSFKKHHNKSSAPPHEMEAQDAVQEGDANYFSTMIGDIAPIQQPDRLKPTDKPKPKPKRRQEQTDVMRQLRDDPFIGSHVQVGDELNHHADHVPKKVLKDLAKGRFRVDEELDLHGLKEAEARTLLHDFLNECRLRHRPTCLAIIHGKGMRSAEGPVLKRMVNGYLRRRGDVLAFASAPRQHGGTGVCWVLIDAKK